MEKLKVATWNVNSLRVRLPHVLTWLKDNDPDILVLQETKLPDDHFPFAEIQDAGYHVIASGQKTYNGVAIISKEMPVNILTDIPGLEDTQRRVLCAEVGNDLCVLNLYIPNGQSVDSDKYIYKLNWLHKLKLFLQEDLKKHQRLLIMGDFNIAPEDIDVHDPAQWEGSVLCSDAERQAFQHMLDLGFVDCFRQTHPDAQLFSWWDYRMNAYKRNLGLRIDHILASNALAEDCTDCYIDTTPREWERPSDHAPVVAEFKQ